MLVEGVDITRPGIDLNRIRQKIGMVFQSFNLYPHMTALGNVTLALPKCRGSRAAKQERGRAASRKVGLAEKAAATRRAVRRPAAAGRHRAGARARAEIMLFDEPTSCARSRADLSVLQVMRDLRESGMTMVVVSHELQFARAAADRVVFMDHGAILEQGPPDQIFADPAHSG